MQNNDSLRDVAIEMADLYDAECYTQALQLGRHYLASDGRRDAEAWSVHAMVAVELNNVAEAMVAAGRAQAIDPQNAQCSGVKALVDELREHAADSANLYEQAWGLDNTNTEYGLCLYRALRNAGRIEDAADFQQQLHERFPGDRRVMNALADARASDEWNRKVDPRGYRQTEDGLKSGVSQKCGIVTRVKRFLEIDDSSKNSFKGLNFGQRIILGAKWMLVVICAFYLFYFVVSSVYICLVYPAGWLVLAAVAMFLLRRRRSRDQHGSRDAFQR